MILPVFSLPVLLRSIGLLLLLILFVVLPALRGVLFVLLILLLVVLLVLVLLLILLLILLIFFLLLLLLFKVGDELVHEFAVVPCILVLRVSFQHLVVLLHRVLQVADFVFLFLMLHREARERVAEIVGRARLQFRRRRA